jgi:hypothetical protein
MQVKELSVFRSIADLPRAGVAAYGTIRLRLGEPEPATIFVGNEEVGIILKDSSDSEQNAHIRVKVLAAGGDVIQMAYAARGKACLLGGTKYKMITKRRGSHTVIIRFIDLQDEGEFADVRVSSTIFDTPGTPRLLMGSVVYLRMLEKKEKIRLVGREGEYPRYVLH